MSENTAKGQDASGNFDPDEPGSAPHQAEDTYPVADEVSIYPAEDKVTETAQALLAAAEGLDLDPAVVKYLDGAFVVPAEVADKANVPEGGKAGPELTQSRQDANVRGTQKPAAKTAPKAAAKADDSGSSEGGSSEPAKAPAKKAAAKKAPAKAAASKATS